MVPRRTVLESGVMPERGSKDSDANWKKLGKILTGERLDRAPRRGDLTLDPLGDVLLCGEISAGLRQLVHERLNAIEPRQDLFRVGHENHYRALAERDHV
jgi:hypothetical protein